MTGPTLTAPFKNTSELSKGGTTFTYVPVAEVVERLNACLGYGRWSFTVPEAFQVDKFIVTKGRLEAMGGVYEQYGGHEVRNNTDMGDNYKSSASDALKKCAAMIGVGLYLSLGRGPTPAAGGDGDPNSARSAPPGEPSGGGEPVSPAPAPPASQSSSGGDQDGTHSKEAKPSQPSNAAAATGDQSAREKAGEEAEDGGRGTDNPPAADSPEHLLEQQELRAARSRIQRRKDALNTAARTALVPAWTAAGLPKIAELSESQLGAAELVLASVES